MSKVMKEETATNASQSGTMHKKWEPARKALFSSFVIAHENSILGEKWQHGPINTVLCKSNESLIRRNSRISGLFEEKWQSFVHLESSKKIQRIFPLAIVLVNMNFRAVVRVYR